MEFDRNDPGNFGLRLSRRPNDTPVRHPATPTSGTMPHDLPSAAVDLTAAPQTARRFVSAEDFDRTGIFTGFDPCVSAYWWMPELYGPMQEGLMLDGPVQPETFATPAGDLAATSGPSRDRFQAARPAASRSTAAA